MALAIGRRHVHSLFGAQTTRFAFNGPQVSLVPASVIDTNIEMLLYAETTFLVDRWVTDGLGLGT